MDALEIHSLTYEVLDATENLEIVIAAHTRALPASKASQEIVARLVRLQEVLLLFSESLQKRHRRPHDLLDRALASCRLKGIAEASRFMAEVSSKFKGPDDPETIRLMCGEYMTARRRLGVHTEALNSTFAALALMGLGCQRPPPIFC